ncbi:EAL domain-containing protein [Motilibacter rhizosphaerae]|uniref:EAL domain-containing protein n=1 Tax=Motilibacter rhizosphaerae TaxID=598652 RepID=UPI0013EEC827|nr:EAL domain-containing protein [Motilibacter rhizosphaerae]
MTSPRGPRQALAAIYAVGAVLTLGTCWVPGWLERGRLVVTGVGVAAALASILLVVCRQLADRLVQPVIAGGAVLIAAETWATGGGVESATYASFSVWAAMFAALYLRPVAYAAQVTCSVVITGSALALAAHEPTVVPFVLLAGLQVTSGHLIRVLVRRLTLLAHRDALTGLLSESGLRAVGASPTASQVRALVLIDVDGFSEVNEAVGREGGDEILTAFAAELPRLAPGAPAVARLSSDVFALLLVGGDAEPAAVQALAERASEQLRRAYSVGGIEIDVEVVVGAAVASTGELFDLLLDRATSALSAAKREDRAVRVWSSDLARNAADELVLQSQLRRGIPKGELVLHYQPQYAAHSGALTGVEALVRWEHPERGLLGPYAFLPLAERSPVIVELTTWVLSRAVAQAAWWRQVAEVPVSVNLSPRLLAHEGLVDLVRAVLAMHGLPARLLTLEVTETAVMAQPERAREVLGELRALGVRISLDDFGTGYTSLAMLADLPLDELKVDRRFVSAILTADRDAAIVRSIAALARRLDLELVAEGVEDEETRRLLAEWGYDVLQGFLLGRPSPVEGLGPALGRARVPALAEPLPADVQVVDEAARLRALARVRTDRSEFLDSVARLAAQLCGTPIALVDLVGEEELVFVGATGTVLPGGPREHSFCTHLVAAQRPVQVPDARQDPRFASNPLVTGARGVRFYAGAPVRSQGEVVGTVCVLDRAPRTLDGEQRAALEDLARIVEAHLEVQAAVGG